MRGVGKVKNTVLPLAKTEAEEVRKTEKKENESTLKSFIKFDRDTMYAKTEKLSNVFTGLSNAGVSSKDVRKVIKTGNRKMNQKLGGDLKQAYTDYKDKKITGDEFKSKLYEAAINKVQGIASALENIYSQKMGLTANNNGSAKVSRQSIFTMKDDAPASPTPQKSISEKTDNTKSTPTPLENIQAKKDEQILTEKATSPGLEKKWEILPGLVAQEKEVVLSEQIKKNDGLARLEKELKKVLDDITEQAEKLSPGLEKKEELPGNTNKVFGEIVGMFHEIDKMVNGLDKEEDGEDERQGFGELVNGLKDMFGSKNGVEGSSFLKNLHKVEAELSTLAIK